MKAAVLEVIDQPLVVAEVGLTELQFGQVLVKVLVSGICGSQLMEIAGHKGNAKFVPHLMGHEGCGIVEDVGVGVSRVKKGDKVIMHWRKGDGVEADFPEYIYHGKRIKSGKVTTFSEYSICSENRLTPVQHDTPEELCALLGCSLSTALGTINDEAEVKFGESVMIVGAGGLGINLIKAAKLASAYPVISLDIHEHKRALALSLGADLFINVATESLKDKLAEIGLKDVDVIIECSGSKKAIEATLPFLSGTGRYIMVGHPKPGESVELLQAGHMFGGEGKTIKATQGGGFNPSKHIERYVRLARKGNLDITGIITHRTGLDDINKAIEQVRAGEASRILIVMQHDKDLLPAYRRMLKLRVASEELIKHYLEKKVFSMVHFYVGQEAVATGVCDALAPGDQVMSSHRPHGHYLARGGSFRALAAELFGRISGTAHGKGGSMHQVAREAGFAGSSPLLGSAVPLAAGLAFAQKYQHKDGIAAVFYGDGASEEGVVYETYNLAALYKLPILFVLENNSWSINSPLHNRRAPGYDSKKVVEGMGLGYLQADGNDYEDVSAKAKKLIQEIRTSGGPAVLECKVYRHMAHSTPLMDEKNRLGDTLEERLKADPLSKLRAKLIAAGVSETELVQEEAAMRDAARADIAWAAEQPYPPQDDLTTNVYA